MCFASSLFRDLQVERIVGKRKNKKGKMEYLVRWRGYTFEGDTWEPEANLTSCVEFINEFNRQHSERLGDAPCMRSTRRSPSTAVGYTSNNNARKQMNRPQPHNSSATAASALSTPSTSVPKQLQPPQNALDNRNMDAKADTQQQPFLSTPTASTLRCSMDLVKSGIKILVPKSPMNSRADSEQSPSEAAHSLEQGGEEPDSVPPEVAVQEKSAGHVLVPGQERARMGTRPRTQAALPPPQVPITPAAVRTLNGKGTFCVACEKLYLSLSIR